MPKRLSQPERKRPTSGASRTPPVQDSYGAWLMLHYGSVPPDIDLEY